MKLAICTNFQVNRMNCVESRRKGGSNWRPPPRLRVIIFSRRLLGLIVVLLKDMTVLWHFTQKPPLARNWFLSWTTTHLLYFCFLLTLFMIKFYTLLYWYLGWDQLFLLSLETSIQYSLIVLISINNKTGWFLKINNKNKVLKRTTFEFVVPQDSYLLNLSQ